MDGERHEVEAEDDALRVVRVKVLDDDRGRRIGRLDTVAEASHVVTSVRVSAKDALCAARK